MIDYWEKFGYEATYHLYNKAIGERKLFLEHEDYNRFLGKYKRYFSGYATLYAYCLIPNHFHFMFRINKVENINQVKLVHEDTHAARSFFNNSSQIDLFLTDQMRRWYSSTSLYLNKKYGKSGQVFLEKTKRVSVKTEEKLFSLLCYIHHNPIHHGLTTSYEAWPYSTYLEYMSNNTGPGSVEILRLLGDGDQQKGKSLFRRMHEMYQTNFEK